MDEHSAGQLLSKRLREADLGEQRFIPVEYDDGKKKPTEIGWQSCLYPAESLNGSMGIVCGDGLVVVDLDDHKADVETPEEVENLPDTFTTKTMHDGEHRYYRIEGEQPQNRSLPWGDIQSESNKMVVAPGTEFRHAECDDECEQVRTGTYTVMNDAPITKVNPEDYPRIFGIQTDLKGEKTALLNRGTAAG